MKFINVRVIQFCIALILGIVLAYWVPTSYNVLTLLPFSLLVVFLLWLWNRNRFATSPLFGIFSFLTWVLLGYSSFQQQLPQFQEMHFSNKQHQASHCLYRLKVAEVLKSSTYHEKYLVEVLQMDSQKTKGKLLLLLEKDSCNPNISIDSELVIYATTMEIPSPLNPGSFNYKKYMALQRTHHQMYISHAHIISNYKTSQSLKGYAENLRNFLIKKLKDTPLGKDERSILQALVLGEKKDIDPSLYDTYAAAGAIHILAVSGLHVGILLLILLGLLKPLEYFRYGKTLKSILIVIILWGFALLAGFSPSVVRAVTMFSFLAFAQHSNRPTHGINNLFLSLLFLLLVYPNWFFHVGFQLSYLAVFFILWVQPKLYVWYRPKNLLLKKLWGITTVTLAAQLGVGPLSIFYFHQFPGLFLLTNLVVLPFLAILLSYGVVVVILAGFDILPHFLAMGYQHAIDALNGFMDWVAHQNTFLFKELSMSLIGMFGIYSIIVSAVLWWKSKNRKWVFAMLVSCIFVLGIQFFDKVKIKEHFVIFHQSRSSWAASQSQDRIWLYGKDTLLQKFPNFIKSFAISRNRKISGVKKIPMAFSLNETPFIVIDSLGVYPNEKKAILWFRESPKLHLERLIDSIQPILIVADGSNYVSYVKRWKVTCIKKGIPFHATSEKGAFIWRVGEMP